VAKAKGRPGHATSQRHAQAEQQQQRQQQQRQRQPQQQQATLGVVLPLRQEVHSAAPVQVLGGSKFWDDALKEVAATRKTAFVASMVYDNSRLQTQLVAARRRGVEVEILVDRVFLQQGSWADKRLGILKKLGAKVFLASGKPYREVFGVTGLPGTYHAKALCLDGFVSYLGSANHSNNSQVNGEVIWKVRHEVVAAQTYDEAWSEARDVGAY